MDVASVEGLEGLSIGRLATELRVSKSGVFAHFGSKEELQLATVRAAVVVFRDMVVRPGLTAPPGLARVWRLCEAWLDYMERPAFPGGCFFVNVAAEFDARPGRVRDAIAHAVRDWRQLLERSIAEAVERGELAAEPAQLGFELEAFGRQAGEDMLLLEATTTCDRARAAMLFRLRAAAHEPAPLPDIPPVRS
jgi:AcrR family transcriptional regulator